MNSWRTRPAEYSEPPVTFTKPEIVGYMSVDIARKYHSNLAELKYITSIPTGNVSFDLNHNIDQAIKRTSIDNVEKIELLLKFLLDKHEHLPKDIHFISYRRSLISIICSAFGLKPIIIVATLFQGHIYLCSIKLPEDEQRKLNPTEQEKKFMAWGYKFEQYMNADSPQLQPDIERPVVENAEFSLYYHATIGSHKLLYGAQIDSLLATNGTVKPPPENAHFKTNLEFLRKSSFVELKTNRVIEHRKQEDNFKRSKMLETWCQCYLANLVGVIVGYRNDQGIVHSLQWLNTEDIPTYCQRFWDPATGLKFLDYFLTNVKNTLKDYVKHTFGDGVNFKNIGPINLRFDIDVRQNIKVTDRCEDILPEWFIAEKRKS